MQGGLLGLALLLEVHDHLAQDLVEILIELVANTFKDLALPLRHDRFFSLLSLNIHGRACIAAQMLSSLATTSITEAKLLAIMMLHLVSTELATWSVRVDLACSWPMARIQAHHTPLHHLSTWLVLLLIVLRIYWERMAAHVRLLSHLLLRVLKVAVVVVRRVLLLVLLVVEEQVPAAHHLWSQRMIKGAVMMADLAASWVIAARHRVGVAVLDGICIWIGVY